MQTLIIKGSDDIDVERFFDLNAPKGERVTLIIKGEIIKEENE